MSFLFIFIHLDDLVVDNIFHIPPVFQGTMVGRGVIEFCDGGPPVRTNLKNENIYDIALPFLFPKNTLILYPYSYVNIISSLTCLNDVKICYK